MTTAVSRAGIWTALRCSGLLADIEAGRVDAVVVYKVDRLQPLAARLRQDDGRRSTSTRSRSSRVTQQINCATSMGRLMLNVLLVLRPIRA